MSTRRQFLQQSAFVSLAPWVPAFLPRSLAAAEPGRDERILVVIQLDGGNDGLNTVVPFAHELYAKCRQELRLPEKDLHQLTDSLALNPGMRAAADLFEEGRLTIVQGVGYPNPNRSHFESMSIWHHARLEESQHDSIGWLGRATDPNVVTVREHPDSIYIGSDAAPVALRGRRSEAISLANEADLQLLTSVATSHRGTSEPPTDLTSFVQRSLDGSFEAAQRFAANTGADTNSSAYPSSELARKLKLVSRLIKLDGGTRVYYVSQPGYDTHSAQLNTHRRLLNEFSRALKAFHDDLRAAGLDQQVVSLAFSEFGRRVQENGSAGTDHGAAGPVFLAGSSIRGGIVGEHPSLEELDKGDLSM
ncbi:MAG: DUF1501 domain-containing protein, partial [Planctomycetaceae bacterium]|nr:DUF1501 domain-containing protein [Planctomycetaceae bacterium]